MSDVANERVDESVSPVLGPFTEDAACQMCGSADIGTAYHDPQHGYLSGHACALVATLSTRWVQAHLCRNCRRCGFKWPEATRLHLVALNPARDDDAKRVAFVLASVLPNMPVDEFRDLCRRVADLFHIDGSGRAT